MTKSEIEFYFPIITQTGYNITSPETIKYNCIAWAANDNKKVWWPDVMEIGFWPQGIKREETVECFIKAYKLLGYEICNDDSLEPNYEKIAIYTDSNQKPTHAARQLPNGKWTSKLGRLEDIEHGSLKGLENSTYGKASAYMKRLRK